MSIGRYIQRVIAGIVLLIPFFIVMVPCFMYMDWLFEDDEDDYVASSLIDSYWQLFRR